MILDTSYVIALAEGDAAAVNLAREHETVGIPQHLPATVLSELYVSVGAGDHPNRNVRKYEQLIGNLPVVDVDDNVATTSGASTAYGSSVFPKPGRHRVHLDSRLRTRQSRG